MIRRVCVLAGMLALFLQGSSAGHMLLVEHARCTEHGELVHSDGEHVATDHTHANAPAVHGTPDPDSEEAHDHCTASLDRRGGIVAVVAPLVSTGAVQTSNELAPGNALVIPTAAQFRIAPKNSPPA